MEFITLWTFSQSWALKNLPNPYWANVEVAAKHSVMEVFLALSSSVTFVAENMVFMMVTAMLKNFYLYLVRHISDKVKPLKKTSRLKAFILHFVSVPAKWVRTGRQNVLNLYTINGLFQAPIEREQKFLCEN